MDHNLDLLNLRDDKSINKSLEPGGNTPLNQKQYSSAASFLNSTITKPNNREISWSPTKTSTISKAQVALFLLRYQKKDSPRQNQGHYHRQNRNLICSSYP